MIKSWLAATAAIALIASAALAQSETTTSTQSTTVTNPPAAAGSYSASKTESTYSDGTETKASETYRSGPNGSVQSYSKSVSSPDGVRQNTYHEEQQSVGPDATVTKKTTSTTTTSE